MFLSEPHCGGVPFRMRVGVTGHRDITGSARLFEVLAEQISFIRDALLPLDDSTPVRLTAVSSLANGADRVVVRALRDDAERRGERPRLEAVLPYPRDVYADKQGFSRASAAEFRVLLDEALVDEPTSEEADASEDAYVRAGLRMINRCDVLVAIWRGDESGGEGGTAETLLAAASLRLPCIWVTPDGAHVETNLGGGSAAARFFDEVARRANVPDQRAPGRPATKGDVGSHLRVAYKDVVAFNDARLRPYTGVTADVRSRDSTAWVMASLRRASMLASRYQRRFSWIAWGVSGLAVTAAALVAAMLVYDLSTKLAWGEFGCFLVAGLLLVYARLGRIHEKWLSCRLLAERLRTCRYIAAIGVDVPSATAFDGIYVERASQDWVIRVVEEIWARRPVEFYRDDWRASRTAMFEWIDGQIAYHGRNAARHRRHQRLLLSSVSVCFVATLTGALFHALDSRFHRSIELLSIVLPAVTGALGVMMGLRQHRAVCERSLRVTDDLSRIRRALIGAESGGDVATAGSEAARVIALESGDWYGAMWFLELEHV